MFVWQKGAVILKFTLTPAPKDSSEPSQGSAPPTTFP